MRRMSISRRAGRGLLSCITLALCRTTRTGLALPTKVREDECTVSAIDILLPLLRAADQLIFDLHAMIKSSSNKLIHALYPEPADPDAKATTLVGTPNLFAPHPQIFILCE